MSAIVENSRAMDEDDLGRYAGGITVSEVAEMAAALGMTVTEFILRSS